MLKLAQILALTETSTCDAWFTAFRTLTTTLGYSEILIGIKDSNAVNCQEATIYSTYPNEWRSRYDSNAYHEIDPVVDHCFSSNAPLLWSPESLKDSVQRAFFEEAEMYGLAYGLALPLHAPDGQKGMFCLVPGETFKKRESHVELTLPYAVILRDYAMESLLRLHQPSRMAVKLTNREQDILKWCAVGKTSWEISIILGSSQAAIDFHFKAIRNKLQVPSRQAAVAKAIQNRLISL